MRDESTRAMKRLASVVRAKAFYNPKLGVISDNSRTMFDYYHKVAGDDNKRLQGLMDNERLVVRFPRLQVVYLERIRGYRRIT